MKKIILFSLFMLLLSSCMSLHSGYLSPLSNNTDVSEFRYIKTISGESFAIYFLSLGGINEVGLVRQAKENMMMKAELKEGQTLINYTVDNNTKLIFFGLAIQRKVIMSADLIEKR